MKKTTLFLLLGLLGFVASCSDDDEGSYPPTYAGFRCEPSIYLHAGDSVFITAVQKKKGHYLGSTTYEWKLTVNVDSSGVSVPSTLFYSVKTNYGGQDSSDPKWRLKLPDNTLPGFYACTFTAQWNNSADGVGGDFQGDPAEGCYGNIISQSYTLYSRANGSFRITVDRGQ